MCKLYDPEVPLVGLQPSSWKDVCSRQYWLWNKKLLNSPNFHLWATKWTMIQLYHGILFGNLKEWGKSLCTYMDMLLSDQKTAEWSIDHNAFVQICRFPKQQTFPSLFKYIMHWKGLQRWQTENSSYLWGGRMCACIAHIITNKFKRLTFLKGSNC